MDLTEFGRVVHSEMSALYDAARLGRSVKGATIYTTTFPCHNCTKHLIAAGISRVVYMEPYPKSRAKQLHPNEIEIQKETTVKVAFVPFLGIAPLRYRDIFLKEGKRKDDAGEARTWFASGDSGEPLLDVVFNAHPELEKEALSKLIGSYENEQSVGGKG